MQDRDDPCTRDVACEAFGKSKRHEPSAWITLSSTKNHLVIVYKITTVNLNFPFKLRVSLWLSYINSIPISINNIERQLLLVFHIRKARFIGAFDHA